MSNYDEGLAARRERRGLALTQRRAARAGYELALIDRTTGCVVVSGRATVSGYYEVTR